jgi:hypothetical protein
MSRGPDVVFLGPTLTHQQARQILPDAVLLPPAAMGDVLAACGEYRPRSISLVDGYFMSRMSVFHKELVYALSEGVWTLGAASMGALRAAECAAFGMIGIGSIYAGLASGEIEDDDEVALTHADEASGFRPLSEAMVTIRATLGAALAEGLVSTGEHDGLVRLQKERWFPDRRLAAVTADAVALGFDQNRAAALTSWLRAHVVDPKRADALELLHHVRTLPDGPIPEQDRPTLVASAPFSATLARDQRVSTAEGWPVTFDRMRRHAALHDDDYDDVMLAARLARAVTELSLLVGGPPTSAELAEGRLRLAELVDVAVDGLDDRLRELDMDDRSIGDMATAHAHQLRVARSWLGRRPQGMITADFVDELRRRGRYDDLKRRTAIEHAAAADVVFDPPPDHHAVLRTFAALQAWSEVPDLTALVAREELGSIAELLATMETAVKCSHALLGTGIRESPAAGPGVTSGPPVDETGVLDGVEPMMARGR